MEGKGIAVWMSVRVTLPGMEGTAWAALNSVTEFVDHERSTRGDSERDRAENRLSSVVWGSGAEIKEAALAAAVALAK